MGGGCRKVWDVPRALLEVQDGKVLFVGKVCTKWKALSRITNLT